MALAERADLIVDFTNVPVGNHVLGNLGPDEPFGGGIPGEDFEPSDPATTGQIMQFRVVPALAPDPTTPPQFLTLPAIAPLPATTFTRRLALAEEMSMIFEESPAEALLGIVDNTGMVVKKMWTEDVTENPSPGATEVWEFYNTTADAHPMHIHEVVFEVVNREGLLLNEEDEVVQPIQLLGNVRPPEAWEIGLKDTVVAYPGEVTRVKMTFSNPGQFTWHCHIVSHEDNEMMRPFRVGPEQPGQPTPPMPM
jgi:FtsP/CotA-like multicopper oxidase with cupredoxin domain